MTLVVVEVEAILDLAVVVDGSAHRLSRVAHPHAAEEEEAAAEAVLAAAQENGIIAAASSLPQAI